MASVVEALDTDLQSMLAIKPPGVSGSKIREITGLCEKNVQNESVIIQKIFTHFKKTPGTHKLGVLYVVDSVTRKWLDMAKREGQTVNGSAPDGTYAAGVNRITELLPILMNDIIQHAPQEQKEKIGKLITIWERGSTFPAHQLKTFQERLLAAQSSKIIRPWDPSPNVIGCCIDPFLDQVSSTPPGSPPANLQFQQGAITAPKQNDAASVLAALANIARQNTMAPSTSGVPAQAASGVANSINPYQAAAVAAIPSMSQGSFVQPSVNVPSGNFASPFPVAGAASAQPAANGLPFNFGAPAAAAVTQPNAQGGQVGNAGNDALQNQLMIIQALAAQGVPQEQWPQLISILLASQANGGATNNNTGSAWPNANNSNTWNGVSQSYQTRDANDSRIRSPRHRSGRSRSRSRSPHDWRSNDRKRRSPNGDYNNDSSDKRDRGRRDGRGGDNNGYRDRSPYEDRNRSASPQPSGFDRPKWIENDPSLGPTRIKVLSRTLFVGGVTCSEAELRSIFKKFGTVQTCIVNNDKRHGFVKMISRDDSLKAKAGMDTFHSPDMSLRTRWGVGFGPRDCSDYQTGISIIPIERLTEADRKWLLTAEFGGTGGKPIVGGQVVEEPDIEIGAGVSSKAISRRMVTDQNGPQGPRSTRDGGRNNMQQNQGRFRRGGGNGDGDFSGPPPGSVDAMPVTASKGNEAAPNPLANFGFVFQNGMPVLPPGFQLPMPPQQQPPQ